NSRAEAAARRVQRRARAAAAGTDSAKGSGSRPGPGTQAAVVGGLSADADRSGCAGASGRTAAAGQIDCADCSGAGPADAGMEARSKERAGGRLGRLIRYVDAKEGQVQEAAARTHVRESVARLGYFLRRIRPEGI